MLGGAPHLCSLKICSRCSFAHSLLSLPTRLQDAVSQQPCSQALLVELQQVPCRLSPKWLHHRSRIPTPSECSQLTGRFTGAHSQQGCWSAMLRRAFQTALLHLKPPPKPSCQMRSPRFRPLVCSMLDRMYLRKQQPHQRQGQHAHAALQPQADRFCTSQPQADNALCLIQLASGVKRISMGRARTRWRQQRCCQSGTAHPWRAGTGQGSG